MRIPKFIFVVLALFVPAALAACGDDSSGGGGKLTLVSYSTPKEAYAKLIPAFTKTSAGQGVTFSQSYGASGDQSRAVESGLPADVVAFSLAPDVDRLVKAGLVDANWASDRFKGKVTDSVVVLAVRKGNPKDIRSFDDLVKPGVEVITPNPFTSGGARWNVMAAYGAALAEGKSPKEGEDFLGRLFENVAVQDKSARESLQTFSNGKGDVLIAYENEAITAQRKGIELEYVIPRDTILIENPIAVVSKSKNAEKARDFVTFLHSAEGQRIYAEAGYRPVLASAAPAGKFPKPAGLFTIEKFGGWKTVTDKFFDPDKGIVAGIEKDLGVSTAK